MTASDSGKARSKFPRVANMDQAMTRRHLAMAERHVASGEQHVAHQREIVARLEKGGHAKSETAEIARTLLREMEASLRGHIADRKRLARELRKSTA